MVKIPKIIWNKRDIKTIKTVFLKWIKLLLIKTIIVMMIENIKIK